ncbi:type IV secretory pathway TraG/TraD family ATPase VirD4 [Rhizobium sp. BK619]|uniref:type IV secretory system conjugative DNA transfer family protein n=1 Tax=Rhizobium sp. BK619 TaxID=2586989 RepID=UPI00160B2553|nr:type IV secretory system conjugative DNA transfer family protein [Rhizobium sp. BK619]MBB3646671.1 type IV secretory pathway TraG/TraD family ATPase VirD4 [Rhizobium sp. BK619]
MIARGKPHPSLLFVFAPVVVTAIAVYIAGWRWPGLAAGMPGRMEYWFLRAAPVPTLLFGPLAGLLTVWTLPLHRRRPVAMTSLLCYLGVSAFYAMREFARLGPSVQTGVITWDRALSYLDMVAVIGAVAGFLAVAVAARISVVVPDEIKRARRGTFGDADWLPMAAAAKLFPPDGEIVVGERYRVDKEIVHELPFDANDRSTWGQGGKAPLLTYKQDFDSTHTLFFAGSGGYKTTSNVVPTALRYTGPLICLDPSTEVAPMVVEHRTHALGREVMVQADGIFRRRALFMLDEVDLLGYMRVLEEARDRGRKYGISIMLMYQSVGQLERHFGKDGATSWIEGCAFASYAAIKALDTARTVSAQCGEMTVEVKGSSRNLGWDSRNGGTRKSESLSFQRRPLIMPHEITQSMRKDEQIIIVQGHRPIRCGRAIYFRRKEMDRVAKANRFVKPIQ